MIVRKAGVTTGAFYGYFKTKEELFDALVRESAQTFLENYLEITREFEKKPGKQQLEEMGTMSTEWMERTIHYLYQHQNAFRLILLHSEGTRHEDFVHRLVSHEMAATRTFEEALRQVGVTVHSVSPELMHILISGMVTAFFEIIIHDMPQEKALGYVQDLVEFQKAGWRKLFGI